MLVALDPERSRATIARRHIKEGGAGMRPGVLDIGGQHHRVLPGQCGFLDADLEAGQRRSDACVEDGFACGHLAPGGARRRNRAGKKCGERAAIDHGPSLLQSLLSGTPRLNRELTRMVVLFRTGWKPGLAKSPAGGSRYGL